MQWNTPTTLYNKQINSRMAIELAILHFRPDISDKDLLDLREQIFLDAYHQTPSVGNATMYERDYYLYSRNKTI